MKRIVRPRVVLSFLVLTLCSLAIACGGGNSSSSTPSMTATVASTQHPLVAQVTVVSSCSGAASIQFGPDTTYGRVTASYPVQAGGSGFAILVAGMRASTTYHLLPTIECTDGPVIGQDMTFQTGPLPSSPPFPVMTVTRPSPSTTSPENQGIELMNVIPPLVPGSSFDVMQAYFTDRDANPIWYYDVGLGNYPFTMKLLPNGHVIVTVETPKDSILREVDLAGNTVREMDIAALSVKTQAAGYDFVPTLYHHDILPLANGHVLVLTNVQKSVSGLVGYPDPTQVLGDAIVDLDGDWNPVWEWNSFDYLDVTRHLNPALVNGVLDWTHSNALIYSPDGALLLSMRHQSWVLKIDYNNGAGSGQILWKLGYQGDFALTQGGVPTSDPSEWFSFQHFPSLVSQTGSQTMLAIWDNGDNRPLDTSGTICPTGVACYSRATVFQVDESAMVADLQWDTLPGDFGIWGGSINQLENGNVEFDLNAISGSTTLASQVEEVTQTSAPQVVWQMQFALPNTAYRTYRAPSLYPGVTWSY
jgi:arylsulfate sulfotransferase